MLPHDSQFFLSVARMISDLCCQTNRPRKWKKSAQPSDRKVPRAHAACDCVTCCFVVLSLARHCQKIPWQGDGRCNMSVPLTCFGIYIVVDISVDSSEEVQGLKYGNLDFVRGQLWVDNVPFISFILSFSLLFRGADASPWSRLTSRGRK